MSDAGPSQPLNNATEGCSEGAGALLRFRGILQAVRHFLGLRAAPTTPGSESSPCDSGCIEGVPCLQWDVLHEIFPDYTDNVNQLQGRGSFNGEGPSDKVPHNNAGMELTVENINELIERFGRDAIQRRGLHGKSLIHHTIAAAALNAADVLFQYAAQEGLTVALSWWRGDILEDSLAKHSRSSVNFLLEKMSQQFASLWETIQVLTNNLEMLRDRFPDIIEKFIEEDKFCFEYGTFSVPRSLFDNADTKPIAFVCSHKQTEEFEWKAGTQEDTQRFWVKNRPDLLKQFKSGGEERVKAVSKFVVIEDAVVVRRKKSIADLTVASCPVNVFKCETVRTIVQWKWHTYRMFAFVLTNTIVYIISALFFFVFTITYGDLARKDEALRITDGSNDHGSSSQTLARASLTCSLVVLAFPILRSSSSLFRSLVVGGVGSEIYLLVHVFLFDKHDNLSAIVVAVHCLTTLFQILKCLRPFRRFGPFVTALYSIFMHFPPFALMGSIMVITFGIALFVLLGRAYQLAEEELSTEEVWSERSQEAVEDLINQYRRNFSSIWLCFEYLLYAIVGNFETEVFHLSTNIYLTACIIIFFSLFVLLAAIDLLSLLISILGDAFHCVIMQEEADLIKNQAETISEFERTTLWWLNKRLQLISFIAGQSQGTTERFCFQHGRLVPIQNLAVFHFLVPEEKSVARNKIKWRRLAHSSEQTTKELIEQRMEQVKLVRNDLETHINGLDDKLITIDGKIDQRMGELEEKLESLQSRLDQVLQRLSNDLA